MEIRLASLILNVLRRTWNTGLHVGNHRPRYLRSLSTRLSLNAETPVQAAPPLRAAGAAWVEVALGLPPDLHSYAILPISYPMGRFGPARRVPLAEVVYEDQWGQPYRDH